jgi:hypothetical protein
MHEFATTAPPLTSLPAATLAPGLASTHPPGEGTAPTPAEILQGALIDSRQRWRDRRFRV